MTPREKANREIHEALGRCWHEFSDTSPWVCLKCGERTYVRHPDYFTPEGFFDVKENAPQEFWKWLVKSGTQGEFEGLEFYINKTTVDHHYEKDGKINKHSLPHLFREWAAEKTK